MRIVRNRYNPAKFNEVMAYMKSDDWLTKPRWQVSVEDNRGRFYDYFFVAKPTRKQIRKLHKGTK